MEKKYQIFISSTYEDLKEERKKVQDTILSMYQFPIGMEMFSAADEEQWEIIKETIDSSDYYVLIIGHRYGSVIENGEYAGISYTQKEFRYALEQKIPVLAFFIDDSMPIMPGKVKQDAGKKEKLEQFKDEVKNGRMVQWWTNKDDLANKVSIALTKEINRGNRPGWVRVVQDEKKRKLVTQMFPWRTNRDDSAHKKLKSLNKLFHKVKRLKLKPKEIILIIMLLVLVSGANILEKNFKGLNNVNEEMGSDIIISYRNFAEEFCEKVKAVLLTPGEGQIEEVKTMLEALKQECGGDIDLEERYIYTLSKCGMLCCELGYIYDASVFTEEAFAYVKELDVSDENYSFIGFCYLNRARVLKEQNQYLEAEEYYLDALHIFEQQGNLINSDLAVLYTSLVNLYYEDAKYADALDYQEKAVKIWKYSGRTNSIDMGAAHIMMARICRFVDQEREFTELMSAKSILENNKPESNEYLMILYGDLGGYYWSNDKTKAEGYFNQARELGLQLQGELGANTINSEINLAYIYSAHGQVQEALEILESAVIKCEKVYGEAGIGSAYVYTALAAAYGELQQDVKSIQYYEKAQSIYENVYGSMHPDVAYVLSNKADTLMSMGRDLEAIECVDRAIDILESNHNITQSDMAELLKKKAEFFMLTDGDLGEAIQLLEQAKQIYMELSGEKSEYAIDIDLQIGRVYTYMKSTDSYGILNYVVERSKEIYDDDSYKMIEAYMSLGECLYEGLGEESEDEQTGMALEYFAKAANILELFNCTNSEEGIDCYEKLGMSSYDLQDFEKAMEYYHKAQDICFILQKEDSLEHRWLWARMARVYAYIGDEEKAKEYLEYTEKFINDIVDEDEQSRISADILETRIILNSDDFKSNMP